MTKSMLHKIVMMTLFAEVENELVLGSQVVKFETWIEEVVFRDSRNIYQNFYLDEFRPEENYIMMTFDFEDAHSGQAGWITKNFDLDGKEL